MENAEYRDLVLFIYEAISDPKLWSAVLDRMTERFSARGCMILEWQKYGPDRRLEAPVISPSYYSRENVDAYIRNFHKYEERDHDLFDRELLPLDRIDLLSETILYEDRPGYEDLPHVKALREYGIKHRTGALLDKDNPYRSRFSFSMTEERGLFNEQELVWLRDLLPHVAKALQLSRPISLGWAHKQTLKAVLDQLSVGICVLDSDGREMMINDEFKRQCDAFDAFRFDPYKRLQLNERADRQKFAELLADSLNHGHFGARPRKEAVVFQRNDIPGSLCIEVVPLRKSSDLSDRPINGALVLSRDSSLPIDIDLDLARNVFDLTKAEALVVEQVCDGLTNSEIAERRERSVETVNSQLKTIFSKTRAVNRTQLVRLLCNFSLPRTILAR